MHDEPEKRRLVGDPALSRAIRDVLESAASDEPSSEVLNRVAARLKKSPRARPWVGRFRLVALGVLGASAAAAAAG